jgi:hypothetical protein
MNLNSSNIKIKYKRNLLVSNMIHNHHNIFNSHIKKSNKILIIVQRIQSSYHNIVRYIQKIWNIINSLNQEVYHLDQRIVLLRKFLRKWRKVLNKKNIKRKFKRY